MGKLRVKWPARPDLLTWFIWHKVQEATCADLDDPEAVRSWLLEFDRTAMIDIHIMLYGTYNDFRLEYVNPRYMDYVGPSSSKK